MLKLKDVYNSNKKPEIEIINDALLKYLDSDINVKPNFDLNKLHKIWHHGVVANVQKNNLLFVIEARGSKQIKICNHCIGNNELYLKITDNDTRFCSFLDMVLKSDEYFLDLKDNTPYINEDIVLIEENKWIINVYEGSKIVDTTMLNAEFFTEAIEEAQENYSNTKLFDINLHKMVS